ncbi:hypothetical protein NYR77_03450 [Actinobacillus equuli subsp. haemolyticus]|uniref:hypothetical protein n=1 Tax=Actinobacillus equuli TaxID=718 RepID=UPI0024425BEE|nr:hypothetical protein [Actinobacillus equuli]WGE68099.1 hypothetical protein NYR77_03450 [Actinobacillus equuli subsp. haemolyticus]
MNPIFNNYQIIIPDNKIIILNDQDNSLDDNTIDEIVQSSNYTRYGKSLLDLLVQESEIKLDNQGKPILSRVFTGDPNSDATRLIGSIAEALVVDYCKLYPDVNQRLGMYARWGTRISGDLDKFVAIATGSLKTKKNYRKYYNPNDTQRDVVWVNIEDNEQQLLCISKGSSSISGNPAGIQVKASHNYQYVLNNIEQYHYPVLYFDLNNDWWKLDLAIKSKDRYENLKYYSTNILIPHDDITNEIKNTLIGYFDLLVKVFNNEITIEYLIEHCKYEGLIAMEKGLEGASVSITNKIIIPS